MSAQFISFFTIFLSVYFIVNLYVFIRGRQFLLPYLKVRKYLSYFFWILPISFILGRVLENWFLNNISAFFVWTGSLWLGLLIYLVIILLLLDFIRLLFYLLKLNPFWEPLTDKKKFKIGVIVITISLVIVSAGFINTLFPKVNEINIQIDKKSGSEKENFSIIVASDIHLGTILGKSRFKYLADTINIMKPELVVFVGDVIDEDIGPVIKEDMGNSLNQINPPLGFYSVNGNHEYMGGVEAADKYLIEHGLKVLRDEFVLVDNSFYLVGREDSSISRIGGIERKTLNQILENTNSNLPIILLDHQPFNLQSLAESGKVDLQISGHTHNGQLWPFNYIVKMIYELPYGHRKIENTQFYVSSGYGTWGPPVRIGNRPEIVLIKINFVEP